MKVYMLAMEISIISACRHYIYTPVMPKDIKQNQKKEVFRSLGLAERETNQFSYQGSLMRLDRYMKTETQCQLKS